MKTRVLLLADIHVGKSRESTTHPGVIRQANTQALGRFREKIPIFNHLKIDLVIQMGDLLRDTLNKDLDSQNLSQALKLFSGINAPKIHLLGNHELKAFTLDEISQVYIDNNIEPCFFGSKTINKTQFIWLDFELGKHGHGWLSSMTDERLAWLEKEIDPSIATIILSHFSVIPMKHDGTFYFSDEPSGMHYANASAIQRILEKKSIKLALNSHVHWVGYKKHQSISYITAPSFTENITALQYSENNPAIYSILEIEDNIFNFKSFSDEFCFANIEI